MSTYQLYEILKSVGGVTEEQAREAMDGIICADDVATKDDIKNMATKADIKDMATKADIKDMATKADLKDIESRMATKDDIKDMATKADIKDMATKMDIEALKTEMHRLNNRTIMWICSFILGYSILVMGVVQMFVDKG